jgi:hypothetical protein
MGKPEPDARDQVVRLDFESEKAKRVSPEPANVPKGPAGAKSATESVGAAPAQKMQRVMSVDALRGFSIFWILGGDGLDWTLQRMTAD